MHSRTNVSQSNDQTYDFKCTAFNCKGFYQSSEYIACLCKKNDVTFVSETWAKPHSLDTIPDSLSKLGIDLDKTEIFSKSGMVDAPPDYSGRPYGGVSLICSERANVGLKYTEVACDNNRILCTKVLSSNNLHIKTIIGVYMPFYKPGCTSQTEEYIATLSDIQTLIDEYAPAGPVQLVGDFNAQLPKFKPTGSNWYKKKGYSLHSFILYDFMTANDLICADHTFKQTTQYSYFQFETNAFTWIDHVLVSPSELETMYSCNIQDHHECNMSDHLPLQTVSRMQLSSTYSSYQTENNTTNTDTVKKVVTISSKPNWENFTVRSLYHNKVTEKLNEIELLTDENITNPVSDICGQLEKINAIFEQAASEVTHGPTNKQFKPKHFWCPELHKLKQKKQFWWRLWQDNGRPSSGHIFEIWKLTKKAFRKYYRKKASNISNLRYSKLNHLFNGKKSSFWSLLKFRRKRSHYNVNINDMADHFKTTLSESGELSSEQTQIKDEVEARYNACKHTVMDYSLDQSRISGNIKKLKLRTAPGIDRITAEHLYHANSDTLCTSLANVYRMMIRYNIIPEVLETGIIIPILKKPTLCQSDFNNYRPITLSSVHAKMIELLMIPESNISCNQYGYQSGKGAEFCHSFINDLTHYFNHGNSPVYVCTLDAVKCFDNIWHNGLFYKLIDILPIAEWRFLYTWYKSMSAIVRVNGSDSSPFKIQKGTRQGSIISPYLFNIFINDLLIELEQSPCGLNVMNNIYNCAAYADDITLLATTIPDMQQLINICYKYSQLWRFEYGIKKTKCLTVGTVNAVAVPQLKLGSQTISNVNNAEILGFTFNKHGTAMDHIFCRIKKARQSMHAVGIYNEELCPSLKAHIWKTVGVPSLTYSLGTVPLAKSELKLLKSTQGTIVKASLHLNKRHHHTVLLEAMDILPVERIVEKQRISLLGRVFKSKSSYSQLCVSLMSIVMKRGSTAPGTLIQNISHYGLSPLQIMIGLPMDKRGNGLAENGLRDSIITVLKNSIKPGSDNHTILKGLTNAF